MPRYQSYHEKVMTVLGERKRPEGSKCSKTLSQEDVDWKHWDEPSWLYRPWNPSHLPYGTSGKFFRGP
jgi:hypothetical protein